MNSRFTLVTALVSASVIGFALRPSPAWATSATAAPVVVDKQEKVVEASKDQPLSVVRVNVTTQSPDFLRPWSKRAPLQRRAVGAVIGAKQVLVTGEMVANATYVELEHPESGEKTPATVDVVDYECNLALITPTDPNFLEKFKPLAVSEPSVGDDLAIWQLEGNGTLLSTRALLTTADVSRYPIDDTSLLLYRLTCSLQPHDGSFTSPVVKGGGLAGMMLRYDPRTQNADVIPAPVIHHFLKAAADKNGYSGFPRAGLLFSALRDPQLRRFAGVSNGTGGVYITEVQPGSAAEQAGIKVGDVITAVGDTPVDQEGNYRDPHYGKVSMIHLLSTKHFENESLPLKLLRGGKAETVNITLKHPDPSKSIIEPYTVDKAPRYYVLGGLVFTELSRQFLKEWGPEWYKKAPERFLYLDRFQREVLKGDPRQRIVILSQVLPSPCTVGYEELTGIIVTAVNGVKLNSLADMENAVANPVDGFHQIEFQGHPRQIILDAKQVTEAEPALLSNYGLPSVKNLK